MNFLSSIIQLCLSTFLLFDLISLSSSWTTNYNHHQRSHHQTRVLVKVQSTSSIENEKNTHASTNKQITPAALPARVIAARALVEPNNTKKHKHVNYHQNNPITKLESNSQYSKLPSRDKAFARHLVSSTIRRTGQIDALLNQLCTNKYPPKCGKFTGLVLACLRMGAAQILFMDVKDFAAVKETVQVLKYENAPEKIIKFVNAILRRVSREEGKALLAKHTSIEDNIAPWLLKEWNQSYGSETTTQMIEQLLETKSYKYVDISLNLSPFLDDNEKRKEIEEIINTFTTYTNSSCDSGGDSKNDNGSVTLLPTGSSIRIEKGQESGDSGIISNWPFYHEGKWWVQDISATLPAIGLINGLKTLNNQNNKMDHDYVDYFSKLHIVDMCAAPGGKTSQLLAAGFGKVTAVEVSQRRCKRLQENLHRLDLEERCDIVLSPGQDYTPKLNDKKVSGILLDVPCSATGTGNRRPDVLRKDSNDVEGLLQIQEILVNHCLDNILEKGGILCYATCSLLKIESEDQIKKLLTNRNDVETLPFTHGEIPGFDDAIDESGWLRLKPGVLDGQLKSCDGFFVARLIKK